MGIVYTETDTVDFWRKVDFLTFDLLNSELPVY